MVHPLSMSARHLFLTAVAIALAIALASPPPAPPTMASDEAEVSRPRPGGARPQPPGRPLDLARLSSLLGVPFEADPSVARQSPLPLRLLGTLITDDPATSAGSVLDLDTRRVWTVRARDRVWGAEVVEVRREEILLRLDGQLRSVGPSEANPASGSGDPVLVSLRRDEVDAALAHLPELASQMRIVPVLDSGQPLRFAVGWIQPGSLMSRIGLQAGDVIRRVNGRDLASLGNGLGFAALRSASHVELEISRAGAVVRNVYEIR